VISTAPVALSVTRKLSGVLCGLRAATTSALPLAAAMTSTGFANPDISLSTVRPCLSHSIANIVHPHADLAAVCRRWVEDIVNRNGLRSATNAPPIAAYSGQRGMCAANHCARSSCG
jgi:hypothetical protein